LRSKATYWFELLKLYVARISIINIENPPPTLNPNLELVAVKLLFNEEDLNWLSV
jgi:hypothetical protein